MHMSAALLAFYFIPQPLFWPLLIFVFGFSIYAQFRELFQNEGVELTVEPLVFEQISEVAFEYKTGARSLRGIFEELITPVLYLVPDQPDVRKVVITSLFSEPSFTRQPRAS